MSLLTVGEGIAMISTGASKHQYCAVAYPTESGNFLCLFVFLGTVGQGYPQGRSLSERMSAWRNTCFEHRRPSNTLQKVKDGYQSHCGDLTMSQSIHAPFCALSFIENSQFAVDAPDYEQGCIKGYFAFIELMDAIKTKQLPLSQVRQVLIAVAASLVNPATMGNEGAAYAFIDGIERAIWMSAHRYRYYRWANGRMRGMEGGSHV